jgi:hypothetical protein
MLILFAGWQKIPHSADEGFEQANVDGYLE